MLVCSLERQVPYSALQMFDLVLDVERYHEFMPFTFRAQVVGRDNNSLATTQNLNIGPIPLRFDSRAHFRRPNWIEVRSSSAQFRDFIIEWAFNGTDGVCRVQVRVECTPRSLLLTVLLTPWIGMFTSSLINAFETRAQAVYGRLPVR
jgi:coenzyme Q-binding protein COQ10